MTDLEKFKAWAAEHQTMDGYPQYTPFDAWIASRRAAIEDIAKGFESEHGRTRDHNYWLVAASMVRAVADGEKN